ncbi:hypothetical protein JTB14_007768 [Gonioctena quinquepunctata]|nr:hypothetical protein JTB14_007768 [Gonioctena quinquepunctata]
MHPLLMTATILDPRFKTKYLISDEVETATTEIVSFLTEDNESILSVERNAEQILPKPVSNVQREKKVHGIQMTTLHFNRWIQIDLKINHLC